MDWVKVSNSQKRAGPKAFTQFILRLTITKTRIGSGKKMKKLVAFMALLVGVISFGMMNVGATENTPSCSLYPSNSINGNGEINFTNHDGFSHWLGIGNGDKNGPWDIFNKELAPGESTGFLAVNMGTFVAWADPEFGYHVNAYLQVNWCQQETTTTTVDETTTTTNEVTTTTTEEVVPPTTEVEPPTTTTEDSTGAVEPPVVFPVPDGVAVPLSPDSPPVSVLGISETRAIRPALASPQTLAFTGAARVVAMSGAALVLVALGALIVYLTRFRRNI